MSYIEPTKREIKMIHCLANDLENDMDITLYTFKDKIPVRIFRNECLIDFQEINDYIEVELKTKTSNME